MNFSNISPLFLSYSLHRGGAGVSARRLFEALQKEGISTISLVALQNEVNPKAGIFCRSDFLQPFREKLRKNIEIHYPRLSYSALRKSGSFFSPGVIGQSVSALIKPFSPTLLHLHWVNNGWLDTSSLESIEIPMVWTFHDQWPMTGGCHYSGSCRRFTKNCGQCPQLGSVKDQDPSRSLFNRKKKAWANLRLYPVAPSRWMGNCIRQSALFQNHPLHIIPYGINHDLYAPITDQKNHLKTFDFHPDKKIITFAAMGAVSDKRKGFEYALSALKELSQNEKFRDQVQLCVIGCEKIELPKNLPFPTKAMGTIRDEKRMAEIYALSDIFLAPSLEDNLPNTVLESLSCGTPVVAFHIGGMPDMIDHCGNGYLAEPKSSPSLARGICWVLEQNREQLRIASRKKIEQYFTLEKQAKAYLNLYDSILSE